jgi:hypothetical protein
MSSKKTIKAMPKKAVSAKKTATKPAEVKLAEKVTKEVTAKANKKSLKFNLETGRDKFLLVQEIEGELKMSVSGLDTETVMFITMQLADMIGEKAGFGKSNKKVKN